MPRTHAAPERTQLAGRSVVTHLRAQTQNADGAWVELTTLLGRDVTLAFTAGDALDNAVQSATLRVLRYDAEADVSLSPEVGGSPANRTGAGAYAPLLELARRVAVQAATAPAGVTPSGPAYRPLFEGVVDFVGGSDDEVELQCRDLGALLLDAQVEAKTTYGTAEGVPLEDALQAMLDDWAPGTALVVWGAPNWNVREWAQDTGSLLEAMRNLAGQIGWEVRGRWQADNTFRLTLFQYPRGKTATDWSIGPDEYEDVTPVEKRIDEVRNVISVLYRDPADGDDAPPREVVREDEASVARYGGVRRWFQIERGASDNIDTEEEAVRLAEAVRSDLSEPLASQKVTTLFFPLVELGDLVLLQANGRDYDSDQALAVVAYEHTIADGEGATSITFRGKVAGAFRRWLSRGGEPESATPAGTLRLRNFREKQRTGASVVYGWDADPRLAEVWVYETTLPIPVTGDPWPDLSDPDTAPAPTARLVAGEREYAVDVPPEGSITYAQFVPMDDALEPGQLERQIVYPAGGVPRIHGLRQYPGASGLFTDLAVSVTDPHGLGGVLRAWTNHDLPGHATPDGAPEGTLAVASTPAEVTAGTFALFDNVRVHPGRGKRIYLEFVNAKGITSGVQSFTLLSEGGIVDEDGHLLPGSIRNALDFAAGLAPVEVYADAVEAGARPDGTLALFTSTGRLMKRQSGAWVPVVNTADLAGQIAETQISDDAISTPKLQTNAVRAHHILTGEILAGHLSADSVWAGSIQAGAVRSEAIYAGAVQAVHLSIAVLSEITDDAGIIVAGKLQSLDGTRYLDLNATGSAPFLHHPAFDLFSNGNARFSGEVASQSFTTEHAVFDGTAEFNEYVRVNNPYVGGPVIGGIEFWNGVRAGYLNSFGQEMYGWSNGGWILEGTGNFTLSVGDGDSFFVVSGPLGAPTLLAQIYVPTVNGQIGLRVPYRTDGGALEFKQVSVGGADSEGPGFRRMRIPN